MEIQERLEAILNQYGLSMYSEEKKDGLDSFSFISMIVEIENEFDISIPDDFLTISSFDVKRTFNYIVSVVEG